MLSLSPRFDLFHFEFPKTFFPLEVLDRYGKILMENQSVITDPVQYINESIQGINIPAISDATTQQGQTSYNHPTDGGRKKLNVEPFHNNFTYAHKNPLAVLGTEFTVKMRQNQGLLNYFMMYETFFHRFSKTESYPPIDVFYVDILNEFNRPSARIKFIQPTFAALDGIEFDYSKTERQFETFNATFNFNNIDFEFLTEK